MRWWARISGFSTDQQSRRDYGAWVITPCTTQEDAEDYVAFFHPHRSVQEWMLM